MGTSLLRLTPGFAGVGKRGVFSSSYAFSIVPYFFCLVTPKKCRNLQLCACSDLVFAHFCFLSQIRFFYSPLHFFGTRIWVKAFFPTAKRKKKSCKFPFFLVILKYFQLNNWLLPVFFSSKPYVTHELNNNEKH